MEYQLIVVHTRQELETAVKNFIKNGWKLQGGTSLAIEYFMTEKNVLWYTQAMVKDDG